MNLIGNRIKERRLELKLTQTQIKEKVGISSGNMSDIENGKIMPSASTLVLLSEALHCSIDWILKGDSLSNENFSFSDKREYEAFKIFRELSANDKNEILELMKFKIFRSAQEEKGNFSHSNQENNSSDIA